MRKTLIPLLGLLLVTAFLLGAADANPTIGTTQGIVGRTTSRWAFMTAWNLATGVQSVSPSWYNSTSVWNHPAGQQQWIARFVYDQSTGQTRELAWFYGQPHVQ